MPPAPPSRAQDRVRAAVIILAAGDGRRAGQHTNKVLLPLAGRRVFTWSIRWARLLPAVTRTVLVIREQDEELVRATLDREVGPPEVELVVGGDTRHGSEWNALQLLAPAIEAGELDVVVIHDAARPLASTSMWDEVITLASEGGGAIPADRLGHLVRKDGDPLPADRVVAVQTPQAFPAAPVLEAYRAAAADGFVGTDTASCIEHYAAANVRCVDADPGNIKITFPDDLFLAERLLAKQHWDLSGGREHLAHEGAHHHRPWRR